MANWYVYHAAAGAATGVDWTNAYTTLGAAATAKPAGDVFFVAHDHAETAASAKTITFAGSELNPNRVYCVNRAGSVPPVSADLRTTAQIITTGASAITVAGTLSECYGIIFNCGTGATAATLTLGNTANRGQRFVNCSFRLLTTASGSRIALSTGGGANLVVLENCTVQFGHNFQFMHTSGRVIWRNTPTTALLGATIPTGVMSFNTSGGSWFVEGVDLSAITSGNNVVSQSVNTPCTAVLKDCKLASGVTIIGPSTVMGGPTVTLIRCDSGDTNYRAERHGFGGSWITQTSIVRTGGASDGATTIAWQVSTNTAARWEVPIESLPISIWNETIGSAITVTIQGIWGGGAVPLNDEIWIDVEYLGTSGFPLGSKATSNKADGLTTGTNLTAGSGTWSGSTTKFQMSATFTPQEKGPITIYVQCGKASSTFYIDPKPVIT